jgi:hypothetical protein
MKDQFNILLSLKTPSGFEAYGQYFLGDDRHEAVELFEQMKGNETLTDKALLHLDLVETVDELPVKIRTICCTLEEFAYNSRVIAKEVFRKYSLKVV